MNSAATTAVRQERMERIKAMLLDDPMLDIKDIAKTFGIKRDQVLKLLDAIGEQGFNPFHSTQAATQ
jgi:predicted ArsR family transcriptional regulator